MLAIERRGAVSGNSTQQSPHSTVAVVGGGAAGSLFALKLARAKPEASVILIERRRRPGRGLAYGACAPHHLLNVPVSRMEVGLEPRFADWLLQRRDAIQEALAESGGDLQSAFVSRELFGQYVQERVEASAGPGNARGLRIVRGEAVKLLDHPARGVLLEDGREIFADKIVLATGNLPPRPLSSPDPWLYDTANFISNPWARDAFDGLEPDAPVLIVGAGLTMVDIALKLAADGHRGPMLAFSRHGLIPQTHAGGGSWEPFLKADATTPRQVVRDIRTEISRALAMGIPWQRVIDAVRPSIARVWTNWSLSQRRAFLRHLRSRWDVIRHRMAPRVSVRLHALIESGQLRVLAGRLRGYVAYRQGVEAVIARRGGGEERFHAVRVINCTGPRSDLAVIAFPLLADLRRRGLIVPDPLALGVETADCAAVDSSGTPSRWLFALGALTRPSWWEITSIPEINTQIERLVSALSAVPGAAPLPLLAEEFVDLGVGI